MPDNIVPNFQVCYNRTQATFNPRHEVLCKGHIKDFNKGANFNSNTKLKGAMQ